MVSARSDEDQVKASGGPSRVDSDLSVAVPFSSSRGFERYLVTRDLEPLELTRLPMNERLLAIAVDGEAPTILVTAGSHADEIAGVFACAELLTRKAAGELAIPNRVVFVPLRDPIGWNGFNQALNSVAGCRDEISSHEDAKSVLASISEARYSERGEMVVAAVNDIGFCSTPMVRYRSSVVSRKLLAEAVREDDSIRGILTGKRVIIPGIVEGASTRNPYGWGGNTAIVTEAGEVGNLNRFFDSVAPPPEIAALRQLLEKERPGLTLDLHEGFSSGFYLFLPPNPSKLALEMAQVMTRKVAEQYELALATALLPIWGKAAGKWIRELAPGIFTIFHRADEAEGDRVSFGGVASTYGASLTTEPGMDANLGDRIDMLVRGCEAAMRSFSVSQGGRQ